MVSRDEIDILVPAFNWTEVDVPLSGVSVHLALPVAPAVPVNGNVYVVLV